MNEIAIPIRAHQSTAAIEIVPPGIARLFDSLRNDREGSVPPDPCPHWGSRRKRRGGLSLRKAEHRSRSLLVYLSPSFPSCVTCERRIVA
jgi:hypothetical protein